MMEEIEENVGPFAGEGKDILGLRRQTWRKIYYVFVSALVFIAVMALGFTAFAFMVALASRTVAE